MQFLCVIFFKPDFQSGFFFAIFIFKINVAKNLVENLAGHPT